MDKNKLKTELAKLRKAKAGIIEKAFQLRTEFVSCVYCECAYDANNNPTFCQIFSTPIKIRDIVGNEERARECDYWIPYGLPRSKIITPDIDRWYEKDSMG